MRLLFILMLFIFITRLSTAKKRRFEKPSKNIEPDRDKAPERFIPVPFGHIFKEGFEPSARQPIDLLELDSKYLKDSPDVRELVKKHGFRNLTPIRPRGYASSKDALEGRFGEEKENYPGKEKSNYEKEEDVEVGDKKEIKQQKMQTWLDLAANHVRNLDVSRRRSLYSHGTPQQLSEDRGDPFMAYTGRGNPKADLTGKETYFSRTSFGLEADGKELKEYTNWTTCDEFGRNAVFHPRDVVNIDWVPFYAWSTDQIRRSVSFVNRFTFPTKKVVQKYREDLGPYLNKTIDWEAPKLFLKSEMEMLLVAVDRKGEFDGLPYNKVPTAMQQSNIKVTLPLVNLRLKLVNSYLAMMFCEYKYTTIMAVSGQEPTTIDEIRSKASTLKFKGKGYPVVRNLEEERLTKQMERDRRLQIEKDKFVDVKIEDETFMF